ncbi:hypothetical protein [Parerythrobacter jejuensis]|uniref:Uncharacterized protein n=1 Tax=Parerythrobacter jejuensis TaxID=795812 RepID=A0A845AUF7_9SPHN|nr:hypothetical protein [Parerythrobacter jejuensis]MXP32695.1 hypothetical protein [Parerythrobacter jejuensis]
MRKSLGIIVAAFATVALGGCTTMRGGPKNVIEELGSSLSVKDGDVSVALVTRDQIIQHYVLKAADKRAFRNRVIDHYMGEMDRQYEKYSMRLFNEGVQTALGFDAAIIGLSSTAALFESSADDLASVISAFAGLQSAVNKNLYFDRTLPALIVTMDAKRAEVEAELINRKSQQAADYSLEAAIRDLRRYQQAGTLMRAVTAVTETASVEKEEAEEAARRAYELQLGFTCVPDDSLAEESPRLFGYFGTLQDDLFSGDAAKATQAEQKIRYLAVALGLSAQGTMDEVLETLSVYLTEKVCTKEQFDVLEEKLEDVWKVKL